MQMTAEEILIRRVPKPREGDDTLILDWLIESLGLQHGRDIHQTLKRILTTLFILLSKREYATMDVLEAELRMPGSRINHHLRLLVKAGMIEREKRSIRLRGRSITETVDEIRRDSERIFEDILRMAEELDNAYGFRPSSILKD